jgi:crotonobetainyl-CoA:carnitine CoA-transferase CaiB-like acyl-CoA transferase
MTPSPADTVRSLWSSLDLPEAALARLALSGSEPVLPSSFAVGSAAQASLALAALAATEIGRLRNGTQQSVAIEMREAALECCGWFTLDGRAPVIWDPVAGLYPCGPDGRDGWIRLHANFAHHRDGALRLLGLPPGAGTPRAAVAAALTGWSATAFEEAAAQAGLVVAALRTFAEWDRHPQAAAVAGLPLVEIEPIGAAPSLDWPALAPSDRPLEGVRVLDLTRILAGPVAGRTLAAYGADVMLVNSPRLPNIEAIADTSRGKRSALADLREPADRAAFGAALEQAHVLLQGYRPGGLEALGFGPREVAARRPGIVYASLSAYGRSGPWSQRRGFDSLVQTATGFNAAEAEAAGSTTPKALPMQILDMASGFLLAGGIAAALLRQRSQGGSWHVQVSLARTAAWLRSLGRIEGGFTAPRAAFDGLEEVQESGFGRLVALRHAARLSATPVRYARRSVPPGTDRLAWD